jgi:hypothetical protein
MQALGSYKGGRMLFLGLGAGLGSAMIVDGILPMELAHLSYKNGKTYEDYVGVRGFKRLGKKSWRRHVADVVKRLKDALGAEYVVLGGGNSKNIKKLPLGVRLGDNRNAFSGGTLPNRSGPGEVQRLPFFHNCLVCGTARSSSQGRAGFARRSGPLTASTVLQDFG